MESRVFTTYALFLKKETHANLGTNMKKFFLNCILIAIKEGIRYSKKCTELHGISRNFTEFYRIVRNFPKFHRIVRSFTILNRIARNTSYFYIK